MLPWLIFGGMSWAYVVFLLAVLRKAYHRHGRFLPRPRPHHLFKAGDHSELARRRALRRAARAERRERRPMPRHAAA